MRNILYSFIFLFAGSSAYSQSEADFNKFGKEVFEDLVHNDTLRTISYIRLREYRDYITNQVEGQSLKDELTNEVNENLLDTYEQFHQSIMLLYNIYHNSLKEGAEITYLDSYYFKKDDQLPDSYTFMLSLLYKNGEMQNEIRLQFDALWYDEMFLFISPVKENF